LQGQQFGFFGGAVAGSLLILLSLGLSSFRVRQLACFLFQTSFLRRNCCCDALIDGVGLLQCLDLSLERIVVLVVVDHDGLVRGLHGRCIVDNGVWRHDDRAFVPAPCEV